MASSTPQLVLLAILLTVDAILLVDARPPENKIVGGSKIDIKDVPWQVALHIRKANNTNLCGGIIINDRWIMTAAHCTEDFPASNVTIIAGTSRLDVIGTLYKVVDVALLKCGKSGCGGTIISSRWILTAAHCTDGLSANILSVSVGSDMKGSGGQVYDVEQIVKHEAYNRCQTKCQNDIAALRTSSDINFGETVAVARLPDAGSPALPVGTKLLVSGWGRTNSVEQCNNNTLPSELMKVEIEVVDFEGCAEQSDLAPDESVHICAGGQGKNACKGDSGGPLVKGDLLVGIVSCGFTQNCAGKPAVYTKVAVFRDWIRNVTGV